MVLATIDELQAKIL